MKTKFQLCSLIVATLFATSSGAVGWGPWNGAGANVAPQVQAAAAGAAAANLFPPGLSALYIFDTSNFDNQRSGVEMVSTTASIVQEPSISLGVTSSITGSNASTGRPAIIKMPNGGGVLSTTVLSNCAVLTNQTDIALTAITKPGRFELLVLLRQQSEHQGDVIMNGATSGTDTGFRLRDDGSAGGYHFTRSNSAITIDDIAMSSTYTRALRRKWGVVSAHSDTVNTTLEAWVGGTKVATTTAAQGASTNVVPIHQTTVGASFACGGPLDAQIGAIALYARTLTSAERTTAVAAMYTAAGVAVTDVPVILMIGDSHIEGNSEGPTVWQQLGAMLPHARITQRALSGAVLSGIATQLSDELTVETPRVIVVEGGVNDTVGGATSAATIAAYEAICVTAHASGAKVIAFLNSPGSDATKTTAINAAIRAFPATEIDAFLDTPKLVADPSLGEGNWLVSYQYDTLHPDALGNRSYAQGLYQIITQNGWIAP